MLQCIKCGEIKSEDNFSENKTRKRGFQSWCKLCVSVYHKQNYQDRREERLKKHKQYNSDHVDEIREYQKQYYLEHKKEISDRIKQYKTNHIEDYRNYRRRRRSRMMELPFDFTAEDVKYALEYWKNRCAICGKDLDLIKKPRGKSVWAVDHWIPLSCPNCPGTIPTNMIPLCHGIDGCNSKKHNSDPIEWLFCNYSQEQAKSIQTKIEIYFKLLDEK